MIGNGTASTFGTVPWSSAGSGNGDKASTELDGAWLEIRRMIDGAARFGRFVDDGGQIVGWWPTKPVDADAAGRPLRLYHKMFDPLTASEADDVGRPWLVGGLPAILRHFDGSIGAAPTGTRYLRTWESLTGFLVESCGEHLASFDVDGRRIGFAALPSPAPPPSDLDFLPTEFRPQAATVMTMLTKAAHPITVQDATFEARAKASGSHTGLQSAAIPNSAIR